MPEILQHTSLPCEVMIAVTLTQAKEMIAAYVAAEAAVLSGKSYTWDGKVCTREDFAEICDGRKESQSYVSQFETAATGMFYLGFSFVRFR